MFCLLSIIFSFVYCESTYFDNTTRKMDNLLNYIFDDDDLDDVNLVVHGIPRRIYQRSDYFHTFDDLTFFKRFRVGKVTALNILDQIEPRIEHPYDINHSVAPINQLLIFLRFCATGSHLSLIGDFTGVHEATASRIVARVATELARLYRHYIKMPQTPEELTVAQFSFYEKARFPRVIGTIDCTHIRIQSPGGEDAEIFRNRKGFFSINVQAVSTANLQICNLVARWPGSTHDSTIFNNSQLKNDFENELFPNSVLLGDSGYNLRSYLLTPVMNPATRAEHLYNEAQIRTRNTVERLFGVWKRRFPVLAYGCRLKLETTLNIITAAAVLQNICKANNEEDPPDPEDIERFIAIMQADEVPNIPPPDIRVPVLGLESRQNLIDGYFATLDE